MKKYLSFFFALLLPLCLIACSREPAAKGPTVSIRIEGISENLAFDAAYPLSQGASALELAGGLLDELDIPFDTDSGYLTSVGHDNAGAFGGWDGFVFYHNGQESLASPDSVVPAAGDVLLFCYADLNGEPPTLLPKLEAARGPEGLVTLTLLGGRLTFQEDAPVMEYVPVAQAELTVNEVLYHTDAQGRLTLDAALSGQKRLSLQAEQYTEDGKPLLIRLEPGFMLELPQ